MTKGRAVVTVADSLHGLKAVPFTKPCPVHRHRYFARGWLGVKRTADPSAALGMTKGRAVVTVADSLHGLKAVPFTKPCPVHRHRYFARGPLGVRRTADPSAALGMTKGRAVVTVADSLHGLKAVPFTKPCPVHRHRYFARG
jgi:uncharacterized CHY-type Zn-finger protein